ncbi:hypothetical protein AS29_009870 [Bacillus sp. SJS]|nr:hypothetical protein AS29_009870 [Bacillus sp. SJS]
MIGKRHFIFGWPIFLLTMLSFMLINLHLLIDRKVNACQLQNQQPKLTVPYFINTWYTFKRQEVCGFSTSLLDTAVLRVFMI